MHQALKVPDVLSEIFEHLIKEDVFACLFVCKSWADSALRQLYQSYHSPLRVDNKEACLQLLHNVDTKSMLRGCLLSLEITDGSSVLFDSLPSLAPCLRHLTITPSASLSASALAQTVPLLSQLESLNIMHHRTSTRRGSTARDILTPGPCKCQTNVLKQVAAARMHGRIRRGLSSLILVGNHDLTDDDLLHYLADFSPESTKTGTPLQPGCGDALRQLTIASCARLTSDSLLHIARYAPNLESLQLKDLYIDEDTSDSPSQLATLLSTLPHLREVVLNGISLSRSAGNLLHETKASPSLTQLSLINMPDMTSNHLLCFPHLQHLHISRCPWIRCVPVHEPTGLQELRTLIFVGSPGSFISYENFFDLCALGQGTTWRPQHGKRGLRKLVIDAASSHSGFSVRGSRPGSPDSAYSRSSRSSSSSLSKMTSELKYAMYSREAIQSTALPNEALFEALRQAEEMQHCAVYGVYRPYAHLRALDERQLGLLRENNADLCVLEGF